MAEKLFKHREGAVVEELRRVDGIVEFANQGGGFLMRMPEAEFDAAFLPHEMPTLLVPFVFAGDWDDRSYRGYTDGRRWNGWAVPLATKDVVAEIAATLETDGSTKILIVDEKVYFEDEDGRQEIVPTQFETSDGPQELFDVGLGWCWIEVDDASQS